MQHILQYLTDLKIALDALDPAQIEAVRDRVAAVRERGGQLFLCGNGGSAATASHLANDLGKGASYGRQGPRFRVIALTDNVPWITALANDVGYDVVFAEQLRNLGQSGDVLLAISGSGNSPNILAAVRIAREIGMEVIAWTGFGGGELAGVADMAIVADSHHMGRVEDVHTILMHLVCYYFMEEEAQA
jgi:D-sedoheptulose 7-phosphate isomerase